MQVCIFAYSICEPKANVKEVPIKKKKCKKQNHLAVGDYQNNGDSGLRKGGGEETSKKNLHILSRLIASFETDIGVCLREQQFSLFFT